MKEIEGRQRAVVDNLMPQVSAGRYPIKRVIGEKVVVQADVFGDGHDEVRAMLLFRHFRKKKWQETPMKYIGNDRFEASFVPDTAGRYEYTVQGWVDHFLTWQKGLRKKYEAGQDISVELLIGAQLVDEAAARTEGSTSKRLTRLAGTLKNKEDLNASVSQALGQELSELMDEYSDKSQVTTFAGILLAEVEQKKALFSSWYELFPRSTSPEPGKHGTFKDCERLIPEIVRMGFDVLYLPPIHPIGINFRKGYNNSVVARPGDPGSPWAIGSAEGGHKAVHPDLGTIEDFRNFVSKAQQAGLSVALDYALQCSPDHPYVKQHPQWFKWRPDGTVQYAENPPKKYQDVLPINFETDDWQNLWKELKSILDFWINQGVKIFRVDNPHTKPFVFWEWVIREIRTANPDVIFLAEAFTRPRIMEKLAKIGFNQSYTYFTWRTTPDELKQYMTELTRTEMREYFRPNFWPNTPDILHEYIQHGGEPGMIVRLVLAATLSSNYGLYGPVYEFGINTPVAPGKEEYLDSEKYEAKHWDFFAQTKIKDVMIRINQIRRENPALQTPWHVEFGEADNDQIVCYARMDEAQTNKLIVVANVDPHHVRSGFVKVPVQWLGIPPDSSYVVHDLITGSRYTWHQEWNYVELHPALMPVHVFRVE